MESMPVGICDCCSKYFYETDNILKQTSNEVCDVFKLQLCNQKCLEAIANNYSFVNNFEFSEINSSEEEELDEFIFNMFITNFPNFAINFEQKKPKKSLEIMKEYIDLKNKDKIKLNNDEQNYLEFVRVYNVFTL